MNSVQYIYNVNYQNHEKELCSFEMRSLFGSFEEEKNFFSKHSVEPSISPYIRNRLEIIYTASSLKGIVELIETNQYNIDDFLVKFYDPSNIIPSRTEQKTYCKEVGQVMHGYPTFKNPKNTLGLTLYQDMWYFGLLTTNNMKWKSHNDKPHSFSSSLGIYLAKVLANAAGNGDFKKTLIDPCCGVGTVLLEAKFAGYDIDGCDINDKVAEMARLNLEHFGYKSRVKTGNIKDLEKHYDAAIIDIPYGILTSTDKANQMMIIKNAKRISDKFVLVACEDMTEELIDESFEIIDCCSVRKSRNNDFIRYIWICR
ncbi:MAG: SAM-dependent methyltransferase [Clostridiales bacterium]|nr:SAM-dependent methyltransferase [Clostridiales bacterium]